MPYCVVTNDEGRVLSICDSEYQVYGAIIVDNLPPNFETNYTDKQEAGKYYNITNFRLSQNLDTEPPTWDWVYDPYLPEHENYTFNFMPEYWTYEHRGLLTYERLWHNGDPTGEGSWYAATKTYNNIYDMFMIICYNSTEGCLLPPIYIRPVSQTKGIVQYIDSSGNTRQRKFSARVTSDSLKVELTIENAIRVSDGAVQNAYCIPFQIYGIKGMTYRA